MRHLLFIFLFALAARAEASIFANLETREVVGVKDGKPSVVVSNGVLEVKTSNPNAKYPRGTANLEEGESIKVKMNPAGFQYYSNLFDKFNVPGPGDFDHPKLQNPVDCGYYLSGKQITECSNHIRKRLCSTINPTLLRVKSYPVDGEKRVLQWLRHLDPGSLNPDELFCEESNLVIGCRAGRCWGSPSSGEYGFYPGKWSTISIDGRRWSFGSDGPTRQQELEIWKSIKDGSRFAYHLIHWPYENQVTGLETISLPKGLKDKIYRMSLEKP